MVANVDMVVVVAQEESNYVEWLAAARSNTIIPIFPHICHLHWWVIASGCSECDGGGVMEVVCV